MNETNWLETQLKSWAPRRPSARIERRLFGRNAPTAAMTELKRAIAWLTPVTACAALALAALREEGAAVVAIHPAPMYAMILSNQPYASFLPGTDSQPENHVDRASFEWTNHRNSGTSIRFMPSTNLSL